jgi:glycosyltransferase involved in cell wall biosynthesis
MLDRIRIQQRVETLAIPMRRGIAPLADLLSLLRLCRALRRLRPDLTEFSTPKAGLLGAFAAWLCGVPIRIYILRGLRLETASGIRRRILLGAEKMAAACSHLVICNSDSLRMQALVLRIAHQSKLRIFGDGSSHGVDVERFAPGPPMMREKLGIPHDVPVVGFVGRLTRDKGVPELIEAFEEIVQRIPAARLLLVGWFDDSEDALSPELRAHIMRHPRIICTGFVDDTAPYYRAMDVMALPTWREGFPNVVLEAAATGLAVVTTLSTGSRDAVIPEVTGLLIPPGYPQAIAEAVLALLRDPNRRRKMGRAARKRAVEHFRDGLVLARTVQCYRTLVDTGQIDTVPGIATDAAAD